MFYSDFLRCYTQCKYKQKEGIKEGKEKGIKQGELIGEIRTLQRILKYPQSSRAELAEKPLKELRALLKKLKVGTEY